MTGLDFGAYDIMQDADGNAYFLEANTCPSVTPNKEKMVSYSQTCMAKGIQYIVDNGKGIVPEAVLPMTNWRDAIHPAIWSKKQ